MKRGKNCLIWGTSSGPKYFSTGWPLFRRSSLKRSFRSRSWMTASFVPWISSSEAILAVLLAFFGNPLQDKSTRQYSLLSDIQTQVKHSSPTESTMCQRVSSQSFFFFYATPVPTNYGKNHESWIQCSGNTHWIQSSGEALAPQGNVPQWVDKGQGLGRPAL